MEISLEIIKIDEIKISMLWNSKVIQISRMDTNNLSANKSNTAPKSEVRLLLRAK